jgi:hypothetical protein
MVEFSESCPAPGSDKLVSHDTFERRGFGTGRSQGRRDMATGGQMTWPNIQHEHSSDRRISKVRDLPKPQVAMHVLAWL